MPALGKKTMKVCLRIFAVQCANIHDAVTQPVAGADSPQGKVGACLTYLHMLNVHETS
jgi:hypothetical protein